jgi:MYND finger
MECIVCNKIDEDSNECKFFNLRSNTQKICINCIYKNLQKYARCMICGKTAASMRFVHLPENNDFKTIFSCKGICNTYIKKGLDTLTGLHNFSECSQCSRPIHRPLQCSRCKDKVYCNRDCQIKNWPQHKKTCKIATQVPKIKRNIIEVPKFKKQYMNK